MHDRDRRVGGVLGIPLGGPFDATRCNVIGVSDGGISDCDQADDQFDNGSCS